MKNPPKKILLVQLFSNGDCLYATTIARQIKIDYPNCHLTWAIASFCKDIIKLNPFVDEILEVKEVVKNDVSSFRRFKNKINNEKKTGKWDLVFNTTNMDSNQAYYDGTIRGMVFRAYPGKITVPVQPILVLSDEEKERVSAFAKSYKLSSFKNIILWEYAPQSGQSNLDFNFVKNISEKLVSNKDTCVILSSANSFNSTDNIIDASVLSVRENAELSKYCNLLIGSSSGITWLSTSTAGKLLPMVQLLNPNVGFMNVPSVDFKRFKLNDDKIIELTSYNKEKIIECVQSILYDGFEKAKDIFNQNIPTQFNTTRIVVYNMLCYLQFGAIFKHFRIIVSVYGIKFEFIMQFIFAIISFPFKLMYNLFSKKIITPFINLFQTK